MAAENGSSPPAHGSVERPVLAAGVILWRGAPAREPEFLLLRNRSHGTWGFAKGHLEEGENLLDAALRETREETAVELSPQDLDPGFTDSHLYRPRGDAWKRVVHFLAAAPVNEERLRVSDEHGEHAWDAPARAVERLAFEDLRRTLVRAAARVRELLAGA